MNWYSRYKFAQIWKVEREETFGGEIARFYELEYKYSMLRDKPFNGLPQRQENILKRVEQELWEATNNVREPIEKTIQAWLQQHALTDPEQWAAQATQPVSPYMNWNEYYESMGEGPETRLHNVIDNYMRLSRNNQPWHSGHQEKNWESAFSKMMQDNNGYALNIVQQLGEILVPEQKEWLFNELMSQGGLEQFNESHNTQFTTEEEAEDYLEKATAEELGVDGSIIFDQDMHEWVSQVEANGLLDSLIVEINQKIVFPVWYKYWAEQGIDETRAAVDQIADDLKKAKTLREVISAVSMALNATHQNGDMLDHLENYGGLEDPDEAIDAKQALDRATSGEDEERWNRELKEIGVQV